MFWRDKTGAATITITESGLAKETTQISGNSKLEDIKTKLDAANVNLSDIEALLAAGNVNTADIEVLLAAVNVNLNDIETLLVATNTALGSETAAPPLGARINGWLQSLYALIPDGQAELTSRMRNAHPAAGYRLWHDTANALHIYVMEAPAAATAASTGFRGIRVTKDADGNPLGKVEVNPGGTLTFNNRTSDGGWS